MKEGSLSFREMRVRLYRNKEVTSLLQLQQEVFDSEGISLERFEPIESFALQLSFAGMPSSLGA